MYILYIKSKVIKVYCIHQKKKKERKLDRGLRLVKLVEEEYKGVILSKMAEMNASD